MQIAIRTSALILLTSCTEISKLQDDLSELTNSFVLAGFHLGAEAFSDEAFLSPEQTEELMASSVQSLAFLLEGDLTGLETSGPIVGAELNVSSGSTSTTLAEQEAGLYTSSASELEYAPGQEVIFQSSYGGVERSISVLQPSAPEYDLPESHAQSAELTIDLSGQGFDSALIVVSDISSGELTYSNEPTGFDEIYSMTHTSTDENGEQIEVSEVTIPANAFPNEGAYLIGVAGLSNSDPDTMVEMNIALSSLSAGQFGFDVVCVPDCSLGPSQ